MKAIEGMMNKAKSLKPNELKVLSDCILRLLSASGEEAFSLSEDRSEECRLCSSHNIAKYGKDRKGNQRYKCKSCGATFSAYSGSILSRSKHSREAWESYIELLLDGASLQKCAEACNIDVKTAFVWRHKILSVLKNDQNDRVLGGVVEADETYPAISYKGNHKNSKTFVMPRPAHKRGTDCRDQTGSRACVMCAIERNGQFYGEVLGKGQPTIAMLSHAFDQRILPDTVVVADKAVGIRNYFNRKSDVELVQVMAHVRPKNMNSPPEIRGAFHIQNVNNVHSRLQRFLYPYNGVSTKYLNHYVALFIWLENHKKIHDFDAAKQLSSILETERSFHSAKELSLLPAIPQIA